VLATGNFVGSIVAAFYSVFPMWLLFLLLITCVIVSARLSAQLTFLSQFEDS